MLLVGLTGGIGSGKSTVSQSLREEGAFLIDADEIARELVRPHTRVWNDLVRVFGTGILERNGSLQRKNLAALVFSDPQKRRLLNEILHPRIKEEMDRRVRKIKERDPEAIVVIDAALLIEVGAHRDMDRVIVVTSTEAQQIGRLKNREGMEEEAAKRIIAAQMSQQEKVAVADYVISNEGSLDEVRQKAKAVFEKLKESVEKRKKGKRGKGEKE